MKNLLIIFALLFSSAGSAQDILSYIPVDATFLFSWNADQVNQKVNTRQLMQQESMDLIFQELVQGMDSIQQEEYYNLITNPETYGINSLQPMHLVGKNDERGSFYAFIFPLTNPSLLEAFVARQVTVFGEQASIEEFEGYKLVNLGSYYLGWNNAVGIVADGNPAVTDFDFGVYDEAPYEYDGEEEAPVEEIEEMDEPAEIEEEVPEEWYAEEEYTEEEVPDVVAEWATEILTRSFGESIRLNPYYLSAVAKPADAHFWIDYQQFMAMGSGGLGALGGGAMGGGMGMGAFGAANQFLVDLYEGTYLSVALNFNQGALELRTEMLGDGKMLEVMQHAYDTKFNRKMLKYIDGRYLLGYYTIRFDVEALVDGFKDILYAAMAEMPFYGETFNSMMDVVGIIVDEDALYDLFKGDIFVGMTGVRQVEIPVTSYEYDLDFNPSEVEKVIKKQFPEFLVMTSYGNEENMKKLVRLGESFGMFVNMGDYYEIPSSETGGSTYLAMNDGVLIFTNDGG
ncbi:MAG: DUF4836 family protein [Saprospirales bacterium]|nr:DUF4836 family protein [Saprospirales bacterium]